VAHEDRLDLLGELLASGGQASELLGEVCDDAADRVLGRHGDGLRFERDDLVDEALAHPRRLGSHDATESGAAGVAHR
jgi:hypothetical protein